MPSNRSNSKPKSSLVLEFEAIGTHWSVELVGRKELPAGLTEAVKNRIAIFDKDYSRFRDDSLVAEMSRTPGNYLLPEDAEPLFNLYHDLYIYTDGLVTPLIGHVLEDAGYDKAYSFTPKPLHTPPSWDEALEYSYPNLRVKLPCLLDVGAAGKGYLIDIVADIVESYGVSDFVVDAGGDMVVRGAQQIQVGLEHPDHTDEAIGIASLQNQALCGSAGNRRSWANFTHIIDPKLLISPQHMKAVWACAESTMLADALTTALYFVEPESIKKHYTFEYARVMQDLSLDVSQGFPAEFFK